MPIMLAMIPSPATISTMIELKLRISKSALTAVSMRPERDCFSPARRREGDEAGAAFALDAQQEGLAAELSGGERARLDFVGAGDGRVADGDHEIARLQALGRTGAAWRDLGDDRALGRAGERELLAQFGGQRGE